MKLPLINIKSPSALLFDFNHGIASFQSNEKSAAFDQGDFHVHKPIIPLVNTQRGVSNMCSPRYEKLNKLIIEDERAVENKSSLSARKISEVQNVYKP